METKKDRWMETTSPNHMTYYDFNRLKRNSHTSVFPAGAVGRNRMVRYFGCGHNRMKIEPPTEKSPIENCVA